MVKKDLQYVKPVVLHTALYKSSLSSICLLQGMNGADGMPGVDGINGTNGANGLPGEQVGHHAYMHGMHVCFYAYYSEKLPNLVSMGGSRIFRKGSNVA